MWNSTNTTTEEPGTRAHYIILVTSLTGVGGLTVSANTILIIILLRFKSKYLKQSTRLFLIYKCLGHACQGLGVTVKPHILNQCAAFGRCIQLALGMSIGGMFLLSLDSFITITKPYRHSFIMSPRVAKLSIFLSIISNISLMLLLALVPGPLSNSANICTLNDSQVNPWVLLVSTLFAILIIFVAMGLQGYNIWTLREISKNALPASPIAFVSNAAQPMDAHPQNISNNIATRMDRLQRLLTVWVISIFVCWMPSCTMTCFRAIMDICSIDAPVFALFMQPPLAALILIDGVLQPCLAVALSQEIRSGVRKLFCCVRLPGNNGVVMNGDGNV